MSRQGYPPSPSGRGNGHHVSWDTSPIVSPTRSRNGPYNNIIPQGDAPYSDPGRPPITPSGGNDQMGGIFSYDQQPFSQPRDQPVSSQRGGQQMMGVFTYDQQPFSHPRDPTTVSQRGADQMGGIFNYDQQPFSQPRAPQSGPVHAAMKDNMSNIFDYSSVDAPRSSVNVSQPSGGKDQMGGIFNYSPSYDMPTKTSTMVSHPSGGKDQMAGIFNYDQQPFSQPKSSVSVSHPSGGKDQMAGIFNYDQQPFSQPRSAVNVSQPSGGKDQMSGIFTYDQQPFSVPRSNTKPQLGGYDQMSGLLGKESKLDQGYVDPYKIPPAQGYSKPTNVPGLTDVGDYGGKGAYSYKPSPVPALPINNGVGSSSTINDDDLFGGPNATGMGSRDRNRSTPMKPPSSHGNNYDNIYGSNNNTNNILHASDIYSSAASASAGVPDLYGSNNNNMNSNIGGYVKPSVVPGLDNLGYSNPYDPPPSSYINQPDPYSAKPPSSYANNNNNNSYYQPPPSVPGISDYNMPPPSASSYNNNNSSSNQPPSYSNNTNAHTSVRTSHQPGGESHWSLYDMSSMAPPQSQLKGNNNCYAAPANNNRSTLSSAGRNSMKGYDPRNAGRETFQLG